MLKLLVKKQLMEVFKGYFYNSKKNTARSKGAVIGLFAFFALIMVVMMGGIFTLLSVALCSGLVAADMGWLYFALMGGIAIILGAFGSVFNTYSGLYLSKDNDLLLSMPIPLKYVIASRLVNVYLMGVMYSAVAILPALIVYWITMGTAAGVGTIICGILLALIISIIVLVLSCILGWAVAKISLKLKNKSFVTVFAALAFIALYYLVYFKASELIQDMLINAAVYGEKIKGAAYIVYLFGRVGEGDWIATLVFSAIAAIILILTWLLLSKSFLSIATSTGAEKKAAYVEKTSKEKSKFKALLTKEFAKFTSNPNYMPNCGLGVLFIPAVGIALLLKGQVIIDTLNAVFGARPGCTYVLLTAFLMMIASLNDMAAPSVSLEGKSIWIPQSLPVEPKLILRVKTAMHLILTGIPMLIASICVVIAIKLSTIDTILIIALSLIFTAFSAIFSSFMGIKMPNLSWTNEMIPIKQGGAVAISIFGIWAVAAIFGVPYLLFAYRIGLTLYLAIWTVLFAIISILLLRWMDTKGAEIFAEL